MKLLLDENVPAPITSTVKTLLHRSHDVRHVIEIPGWGGTKDLYLYGKAKDAGFEVVVTNDAKQMNRKLEVEAIAKSGLHRIQYPQRQDGIAGLGLALAAVCAALPPVLRELADADGQRLVTLKGIDPAAIIATRSVTRRSIRQSSGRSRRPELNYWFLAVFGYCPDATRRCRSRWQPRPVTMARERSRSGGFQDEENEA